MPGAGVETMVHNSIEESDSTSVVFKSSIDMKESSLLATVTGLAN